MGVDLSKIEIRGLTRGQIKDLRKDGITLQGVEKLEEEARDDAIDKVFALACPDLDVDDITPGQGIKLYVEVIEKTYAGDGLIKKSASPRPSTSRGGGMSAKSAEKPGSGNKDTARKSKKKNG